MSDSWQWLLTGAVLLWALVYVTWWAYRGLHPSTGGRARGCGGCSGCQAGKGAIALVPLKRNNEA